MTSSLTSEFAHALAVACKLNVCFASSASARSCHPALHACTVLAKMEVVPAALGFKPEQVAERMADIR